MAPVLMDAESVKTHCYCIPSESSRNEQAVHMQTDLCLGYLFCVQLSVKSQFRKVYHREDRVLTVGIYDVRVL